MMAKATKKQKSFIASCLEPIPGNQEIDLEYNRLVRKSGDNSWRPTYVEMRFYDSLLDCLLWSGVYFREIKRDDKAYEQFNRLRFALLDRYRQSVVALLRAPISIKSHVKEKQVLAKQPCLPITQAEIDKILARDEAFLAAHPVFRPKVAPG